MASVVHLANFRHVASEPHEPSPWPEVQHVTAFTARDRSDLEEWVSHGRRVSWCSCELGVFAMLYENDVPWASWGVVRQRRSVLLWDCVTHTDIGRFPSMFHALRAVPRVHRPVPIPSVLPFCAAHLYRATAG